MLDQILQQDIITSVQRALAEDIGSGDITAQLIPEDSASEATIISRENAVICGIPWVNEVFRQLDPNIALDWAAADGDNIIANQTLCHLKGNSRALLTGERTALNFLQTLSGTATVSREYAQLVEHSSTRILDTRKTLPGLRLAQKYAVKTGGCHNHRLGLYDAFLIKENHIAACGGIGKAVARARELAPDKPIEVEVETLDELAQALAAKADRIMLDNFSEQNLLEALTLNHQYDAVELEVSGNIDKGNLSQRASSGLDFISIGALTKHCKSIDFSMRIQI